MLTYTGPKCIMTAKGDWSSTATYEPLDIVYDTDSGNSYVAKIDVPAGTPLTDTTYWALSSSASGAISDLRTDVDALQVDMAQAQTDIASKVNTADVVTTEADLKSVTATGKLADATLVKGMYFKTAADESYDNTTSGLTAANVQDAIDEVYTAEKSDFTEQEEDGYLERNINVPYTISTTNAGVTFTTVDGVVTASGTATGNAYNKLSSATVPMYDLKAGTYTLCTDIEVPSGMRVQIVNDSGSSSIALLTSGNYTTFTLTNEATNCFIRVRVDSGATVSNVVITPYLVRGSSYKDYLPYAPSNVELNSTLTNIVGDAWTSGIAYAVGDCAIYNNTLYACILEHTSSTSILPTNTTYWERTSISNLNSKIPIMTTFTYTGSDVSIESGTNTLIELSSYSMPTGYAVATIPSSNNLPSGVLIATANTTGSIRLYNFGTDTKTLSSGVKFTYLFMRA